jgi:hypothetical protein
MNLESQVCSLDLAKRLKELGVKQESFFWYGKVENPCFNETNEDMIIFQALWQLNETCHYYTECCAFNVSELGEMLPEGFSMIKHKGFSIKSPNEWDRQLKDANEANARAKMLIYLIENGLVKAEDINDA